MPTITEQEAKQAIEDIDYFLAQERVTVFDGPGRGRKQCPNCKQYVGARISMCKCAYKFTKGETTKLREKPESILFENKDSTEPTVESRDHKLAQALGVPCKTHTRAIGHPPEVSLDLDKVPSFCEQLVLYGYREFDTFYTPEALKHLVGHRYGFASEVYDEFCVKCDQWVEDLL